MTITRIGLTGLALTLLLSACSGPSSDGSSDGSGQADVATLATETAAAGASPTASPGAGAPQERPLLRPDASDEEEDRLYDVYWTCLSDHGVPGYKKSEDGDVLAAPKAAPGGGGEDDPAALAACANVEPEAPWQRAQRTDPRYADKLRDWITCVRSHGIDAFEEDGFLAFESLPSDDKMKLVDECEMKAFNVG